MWEESQETGTRIFFADAAHFRAEAELRGKWVQKGRTCPGGLDQSQLWREGQLLLGGMFGNWGCGVAGTGWQQQLGHLGCFPEATERDGIPGP